MKMLLTIAVVFSASAFGFAPDMDRGIYVGGGTWKMPSGETGKYHHRTAITKAKGGMLVEEHLVIHHNGQKQAEDMRFMVQQTSNGFFDILVKGAVAGNGYCLNRTCHMNMTTKEGVSEETFHFAKNGRVMRLGSDRSKNHTVVWSGSMRKQKPAPKK